MIRAALYLRSSKDRADASIDAQRRELQALAAAREMVVIEEFADPVERADDGERPGFQAMLRRLKDRERNWSTLLVMDTSRIARQNQYLAAAFNFECEKRGIHVLYSKLPETNTIMDVVTKQMMRAFDQLHSLMSREKGLAGMAENVRQGWRAGGRAPFGFQLQAHETGAIREGAAVTKSKLVPDENAKIVGEFLRHRAAGTGRARAIELTGVSLTASTLVGIEWNALTYAGHTVWNVHSEQLPGGGYKGGQKRRPRSEWLIQYDTHPGLISTDEAEAILAHLEASPHTKGRRPSSESLLGGLLRTADGRTWHAEGEFYRLGKGKRVNRAALDRDIVKQVLDDLHSDAFVKALLAEARKATLPIPDTDVAPMREKVSDLTRKIGRATELAMEAQQPRPWLEKIEQLEKERAALVEQLERAEAETRAAESMRNIRESDVRAILSQMAQGVNVDSETGALKDFLRDLVEWVELEDSTCRNHYLLSAGGVCLASPRGFEPRYSP